MIGTRGHDIAVHTNPADLAEKMQGAGFDSVQLVAYRSIKGIPETPGHLSSGLAYSISHEFDKRGIHIALLGSYFNMLEQDPIKLASHIERFKEYLRFAKDFRCSLVATETGSYNPDMSYHPDNHGDKALETVIGIFRDLVGEAERHGVMVGLEGLYNYTVSTPKRIKEVLDAVGSSNLQVVFDPVNLLNCDNYRNANEIIKESFELFGDRIMVIHAKDFIVDGNTIRTVPLGQGLLDYDYLLDVALAQKPSIDIIIEDLRGDDLSLSRDFLKAKLQGKKQN